MDLISLNHTKTKNNVSSTGNQWICLASFLFSAFFICWSSASGQETLGPSLRSDVPFSDHVTRTYHGREGLPSGFVYDSVQTSDGYIWFATHGGIARFDGFKFKVFTRANSPIPSNDTRVLFEDSNGTLWAGTTGGLARQVPDQPGKFEAIDAFTGNSVHAIYEDSTGSIWIGTREQTWEKSSSAVDFAIAENSPSAVYAFCETAAGQMLFGTRTGLFLSDSDACHRIQHERLPAEVSKSYSGIPPAAVNKLVPVDGGVWVCANRGLLFFKDGKLSEKITGLGVQRVSDALILRNGDLYVASTYATYRAAKGSASLEKMPLDIRPNCLLEDFEGGLWVGNSANRGVQYFANNLFRTFLPDQDVLCVFEDSSQDMWFGTRNGLFRRDPKSGQTTSYGEQHGLPHRVVSTISSGDGKTLWIGTGRGFVKWDGTKFEKADVSPEMSNMNIKRSMVDSSGNLWFALANGGAYRLASGELEQIDGLSHGDTQWFFENSPNEIWVGHEFGLFRISDDKVQEISDPAFVDFTGKHFISHFVDPDGTLWIGTTTGIGRYKNGKFDSFSSANGLAADYIDRLVTDAHGNLWCGGRDGCFLVPIKELDEFSAGKRTHFKSRRITMLTGVEASARGPKVCYSSTGDMWMAGRQGVIRVAEINLPKNRVPPNPKIELVQLDGEVLNANRVNRFPSGRHRLILNFGAASFLDPDNVQVKHRLLGYDSDWVVSDRERTAHYTDLTPGDYQFEVTATNEDGVAAVSESTFRFTVHPRWFETVWFRTAFVLGLIGSIAISTRQYTQRVHIRNFVLQKEIDDRRSAEQKANDYVHQLARLNRAASLGEMATSIAHEVKQPLFAIVGNAQIAQRLLRQEQPDMEEVHAALGEIVGDGNRAASIIENVRSLVRKEQQSTEPLDLNEVALDAIKFIMPEIRDRGLTLKTEFADSLPTVHGNSIELKQVILNLVINGAQSMRHVDNGSNELLLRTAAQNGFVELVVRDHGVGIKPEQADRLFEPFFTTKPQGMGMGLAINRTIIEAHQGRIWATVNKSCGATFRFQLPAAGETKS